MTLTFLPSTVCKKTVSFFRMFEYILSVLFPSNLDALAATEAAEVKKKLRKYTGPG